jgi:hypothetical protein
MVERLRRMSSGASVPSEIPGVPIDLKEHCAIVFAYDDPHDASFQKQRTGGFFHQAVVEIPHCQPQNGTRIGFQCVHHGFQFIFFFEYSNTN